jgi:hypothetical protein
VIEMKVRELIAVLEDLDPEAAVYIMSQPNYPFEHAVSGVALREDFTECDDEDEEEAEGEEDERPAPTRDRWTARDADLPPSDVFILEGAQLRYGSREAWKLAAVARRRQAGAVASGAAPPPATQPAVSRRRA